MSELTHGIFDTRQGAPEGGQETAREFADRIWKTTTCGRFLADLLRMETEQRDAETRRRAFDAAVEAVKHSRGDRAVLLDAITAIRAAASASEGDHENG